MRVRETSPVSPWALFVVAIAALMFAACGEAPVPPWAGSEAPGSPSPTATEPSRTPSDLAPSSTSVPSASAPAVEACALLNGAELATILDVDNVQPRPMPNDGWIAGQCAWNGSESGFFLSVGTAESITASGDATVPDARAKLAQFKEQAGSNARDVPGIGDGAVIGATGLAAYRGRTYVQFTNLGLTEDQLIQIATLAVGRL
jgi:hypothetical protein